MIQSTSLQSLLKLDKSPYEREILRLIRASDGITNKELADALHTYPSTISGVNNEAFRAKYNIVGEEVKRGYGGRPVQAWKVEKISVQTKLNI